MALEEVRSVLCSSGQHLVSPFTCQGSACQKLFGQDNTDGCQAPWFTSINGKLYGICCVLELKEKAPPLAAWHWNNFFEPGVGWVRPFRCTCDSNEDHEIDQSAIGVSHVAGVGSKNIQYNHYSDESQSTECKINGFQCGLCSDYTKQFGLLGPQGDAFQNPETMWDGIQSNQIVILCSPCTEYAGIQSSGFRATTRIFKYAADAYYPIHKVTYSADDQFLARFVYQGCVPAVHIDAQAGHEVYESTNHQSGVSGIRLSHDVIQSSTAASNISHTTAVGSINTPVTSTSAATSQPKSEPSSLVTVDAATREVLDKFIASFPDLDKEVDELKRNTKNVESDEIEKKKLASPKPHTALDDDNLRAAIHMFMGDLCDAIRVPFVPPELRTLIADYAMQHVLDDVVHYYIVNSRYLGGFEQIMEEEEGVSTKTYCLQVENMRTWSALVILTRMDATGMISREHFPEICIELAARYVHIPLHLLIQATLRVLQKRWNGGEQLDRNSSYCVIQSAHKMQAICQSDMSATV